MPCEACNAQFSVFRRKRSCTECRRLYCSQCLVKRKEKILCDRCVVFTTRPLTKIELLKLKPKDLIFYLQSKHVSTTGCVEKEELVNLVLIHINNSSSSSNSIYSDGGTEHDDNFTNPFDQIKQTCQNLFSSFTDKIVSDLKQSTSHNNQNSNISSQPRSVTRTSSGSNVSNKSNSFYGYFDDRRSVNEDRPPPSETLSTNRHANNQSSPVRSVNSSSSIATTSSSGNRNGTGADTNGGLNVRMSATTVDSNRVSTSRNSNEVPSVHCKPNRNVTKNRPENSTENRDDIVDLTTCDCSSDEMINTFHVNYNRKNSIDIRELEADPEAGPSGSSSSKTGSSVNRNRDSPVSSGSDTSSFEEIKIVRVGALENASVVGAVGGGPESWQIIGGQSNFVAVEDDLPSIGNCVTDDVIKTETKCDANSSCKISYSNSSKSDVDKQRQQTTFQEPHSSEQNIRLDRGQQEHEKIFNNSISNVRRLPRRRSDSCISSNIGLPSTSDKSNAIDHSEHDEWETGFSCKRSKTSCQRCGRSRGDLKRHVAKFRQQLEDTNASESEIKEKMQAFLQYLESVNRSSTEASDTDSIEIGERQVPIDDLHSPSAEAIDHNSIPVENEMDMHGVQENLDEHDSFTFGEDDGIHVYAVDHFVEQQPRKQFISLNDYEESSDLDGLSVKQLKQLLMLNRVDFKGCCEKSELLERVKRLWNDSNTCPAVEKLPTDDLCKICMDAPIECVILECGHMATCTSCGKVLNECPICRQYIVRVVRFFRA